MTKKTKDQLLQEISQLKENVHKLRDREKEFIKTEHALKKSEEKYRSLFEKSTDPILILDKYTFIDCNETTCKVLKCSSKKWIIGKSPWDISPEVQFDGMKSHEKAKKNIDDAIKRGYNRFEWIHVDKNGNEIWMDIALTHFPDNNKNFLYTVWRDITHYKDQEFALREGENKLSKILDSFYDGIYITSPDYTIEYMNKAMSRRVGESNIGKKCYRIMYNKNKPCEWCKYDILTKKNSVVSYDFKLPDKDEYRLVQNILLDNGSKMSIYYDITDRKRAEEALKESEEKATFLSDVTFEGIVIHKKGFVIDANESFLKLTGYTKDEVIGENLLDYIPRTKDKAKIMVNIVRHHALPYTILARRKDGTTFIAELEARNIKHGGRTVRIVAVRDVTERVKAQRALKESEELFRTIFEQSASGMVQIDLNGKVLKVNQEACDMLGYTEKELLNQDYLSLTHPDDIEKEKQRVDELYKQKSKKLNFDMRFIHKNGNVIWAIVSASLIVNIDGEPVSAIVSINNITERIMAEKQLEKNLREKEILIREVHHRVKNNMQVISAILSLQADEIGDERLSSILDECQRRVHSMSKVHEMMYRTRDLEHLDMAEYAHELIQSLKNMYPLQDRGISIIEDCKDVYMNLNQAIPSGIIMNEFISNAMKHAFPKSRKGKIEVKLEKKNSNIHMTVSNDGVPLPKSFNIEEPTSLGLEIVNLLTKQLNGDIEVKSDEGGTYFRVIFPE